MMQFAKHRLARNTPSAMKLAPASRVFNKRQMNLTFAKVALERREQAPHVNFIADDDVGQTFAPDGPEDAFDTSTLPRGSQ